MKPSYCAKAGLKKKEIECAKKYALVRNRLGAETTEMCVSVYSNQPVLDGHRNKKPRLDHLNWEQIEQRFLGERVTMNTKEENAFLDGGLGGWVPGNLD